jgi:hypothetical protein
MKTLTLAPTDTFGYRHHNPLNMRPLPNGQMWVHQIGSSQGFCIWDDVLYCFRAWKIEARAYVATWGCRTVFDYIRHYAPSEDGNDPVTYSRNVEKYMGLQPNEAFNLEEMDFEFCKGQMVEEIGGIPYSELIIHTGLGLADHR